MDLFGLWQDWLPVAGALLGLTTILVGIVYALSELLMNDKMKSWAKMELIEVIYSVIIISMAMIGLPLIDAVVQGSLGVANTGGASVGTPGCSGSVTSFFIPTTDYGQFQLKKTYTCMDICGQGDTDLIAMNNLSVYHGIESCHMRLGIWYLREVFDETKNYAFDIYLSYIRTSMISQFTINIEFLFEKAGFFTFTPWAGFYTMGNKVKEMTFDWAMKVMMLTKFQEILLRFIATALFPAMFVIGVVLRTFTFTRKLGGLLLAMAISLYFIFPSFYAFGALIMLDIKNDPTIQSAWMTSDANPGNNPASTLTPADFPDPPIADSMYIRGDIPMPGGSGGYSTEAVRAQLRNFEGLNSNDYYKYMEAGAQGGNALLPQFDLTSTKYSSASQADQNASLINAKNAADQWFGNISSSSSFDKFIGLAWSAGGPIDTIAKLTFWSLFFSLFSVLATIAAIRSLSITFGGDIEIAGLTRLI